eukprot:313180-Chlamydomonas_euryale.AAC.7
MEDADRKRKREEEDDGEERGPEVEVGQPAPPPYGLSGPVPTSEQPVVHEAAAAGPHEDAHKEQASEAVAQAVTTEPETAPEIEAKPEVGEVAGSERAPEAVHEAAPQHPQMHAGAAAPVKEQPPEDKKPDALLPEEKPDMQPAAAPHDKPHEAASSAAGRPAQAAANEWAPPEPPAVPAAMPRELPKPVGPATARRLEHTPNWAPANLTVARMPRTAVPARPSNAIDLFYAIADGYMPELVAHRGSGHVNVAPKAAKTKKTGGTSPHTKYLQQQAALEARREKEAARRAMEEAQAEAAAANRLHGYSTRKRNATKNYRVCVSLGMSCLPKSSMHASIHIQTHTFPWLPKLQCMDFQVPFTLPSHSTVSLPGSCTQELFPELMADEENEEDDDERPDKMSDHDSSSESGMDSDDSEIKRRKANKRAGHHPAQPLQGARRPQQQPMPMAVQLQQQQRPGSGQLQPGFMQQQMLRPQQQMQQGFGGFNNASAIQNQQAMLLQQQQQQQLQLQQFLSLLNPQEHQAVMQMQPHQRMAAIVQLVQRKRQLAQQQQQQQHQQHQQQPQQPQLLGMQQPGMGQQLGGGAGMQQMGGFVPNGMRPPGMVGTASAMYQPNLGGMVRQVSPTIPGQAGMQGGLHLPGMLGGMGQQQPAGMGLHLPGMLGPQQKQQVQQQPGQPSINPFGGGGQAGSQYRFS